MAWYNVWREDIIILPMTNGSVFKKLFIINKNGSRQKWNGVYMLDKRNVSAWGLQESWRRSSSQNVQKYFVL